MAQLNSDNDDKVENKPDADKGEKHEDEKREPYIEQDHKNGDWSDRSRDCGRHFRRIAVADMRPPVTKATRAKLRHRGNCANFKKHAKPRNDT
jgi:hypothetical protein